MADPRRLPSPVYVLDEQAVEKINATALAVSAMQLTMGSYAPDGKAGTGLVGEVANLRGEVQGLVALKNIGRGVLIGAVVAAGVLLLGVAGALRTFGFTVLGLH